jgi:tRNA-modifying protein YgfZ
MNSFVDVTGRVAIQLDGSESLDFIQRVSTNDVASLQLGGSRQTVLTNEKGRIIEVVTVLREAESRLSLFGQSSDSTQLTSWLEKYIIMEDIRITDLTSILSQYILYNSNVTEHDRIASYSSQGLLVVRESFGATTLVRLACPPETSEYVERTLIADGGAHCTPDEFEEFRIMNGIPASQRELTPQYNPLEANLGALVSWTKGCYIGQEVIARLDTYKKVQRRLVTIKMQVGPEGLPVPFYDEGGEAGVITSAVRNRSTGETRGIGYLKTTGSDQSRSHYLVSGGARTPLEIQVVS